MMLYTESLNGKNTPSLQDSNEQEPKSHVAGLNTTQYMYNVYLMMLYTESLNGKNTPSKLKEKLFTHRKGCHFSSPAKHSPRARNMFSNNPASTPTPSTPHLRPSTGTLPTKSDIESPVTMQMCSTPKRSLFATSGKKC